MNFKNLLGASVLCLSLLAWAGVAGAQLPNCDCYFNSDCGPAKPICQYTQDGSGPTGPTDPNRACNWMTPKPPSPGLGCESPYEGTGSPCDGVCVSAPPPEVKQHWEHWDGRPGTGYEGDGCLEGGPYPYFVKFVVENEPCDLPAHCSICEANISVPSGILAEGTAALVGSELTAQCSANGFTFDVMGRRVIAEIEGQLFDVCVNGVKVASRISSPEQALVCQDSIDPVSFQVAGDFNVVPGLSARGFAILVALILTASAVVVTRRAGARSA